MSATQMQRPRLPVWEAVPRVLTIAVLVVIGVAVVVNVATAAVAGAGVLGYIAIAFAAGGVVLALRHPYAGLVLVVAAAPLAVAGNLVSTGIWSIACFAAFLLTLRGASALICGAAIAVSNFVAAGWEVGTIDVNVNASASVAAFAAVIAAAIGSAMRGNLRYRHEVEQRIRDAETNRATAIERGVAQERLRIARDLHDGVGHHVAVVNMRLGAAEVHLPPDSDTAQADIAAARAGLQEVLRETQHILRVLRVEGGPDRSEHVYRSVPDLLDTFRAAGMHIEDRIDDDAGDMSPQASAAVYRIVQEGLTNAQKHGAGSVSVTLKRVKGEVRIQIVNRRATPGSSAADSGGIGLVGMRERAESAGGSLDVGADDRLFWLTATIPTRTGEI